MTEIFKNDWAKLLNTELEKPYYKSLRSFLIDEYRQRRIFPSMYDIFNALHYTPYKETKVVILGQDPYHGAGQAHGLSFSCLLYTSFARAFAFLYSRRNSSSRGQKN